MSDTAELALETETAPDLVAVTRSLHHSYDRLLRRVARMEADLARANAALQEKVHELDAERSQLNAVLQAAPAGMIVSGKDGIIAHANPAAERILGVPVGSLAGRRRDSVCSDDQRCLLESAGAEQEYLVGGRALTLRRTCSTIVDSEGRGVGVIDMIEDCSERRRLEARVKHQEKLAALGQMSATIAHEVRNPLHAVEGFAGLLLRAMPEGREGVEKPRQYATNIVRGVRELNSIVTNLLEFSRADRFRPAARDLVRIARRAADLALAAVPPAEAEKIQINFAPSASVTAEVDDVHMLQAIRNLVGNAIEAMPQGGVISIRVHEEAGGAMIEIGDEGPGVAPELRSRIFQPFFTTKSRGTGLGLAVVVKAAELHGGKIELRPSPKGALFTLWVPKPNQVEE